MCLPFSSQELSDRRETLDVVAEDLEDGHERHRERARTPQTQPQKDTPRKMASGLSLTRRPTRNGVTK